MCPQNLIFLLCVMVATFLWQTKYLYLLVIFTRHFAFVFSFPQVGSLITLSGIMQIIDTCEANGVVVSHSVLITNIVWVTSDQPHDILTRGLLLATGSVWRRYLFICCHQICIQLVNNTQWQLNGPVCTQNIEPTRALFGLNICSILSFLWTQRRPGETL